MATPAKTAIITGASSGIGRSTAIALSKAGWNVVGAARREQVLLETIRMCPNPAQCLAVSGDVSDEAFVKTLFSQTLDKFGRLDLLFNNAGINVPQTTIEELSLHDFQSVQAVNVTGPFLCTREAFKVFKAQDPPGGRIINNGSLSAHVPRPFTFAYTTSKHAMNGLTKCTSLDGRKYNIACTQIDIGNAITDFSTMLANGTFQANGEIRSEAMIDVQHVADTIVHVANLPNDVTVLQLTVMPTKVPFVGRG